MIAQALILLREELNEYIRNLPGNQDLSYIILGNVSALETDQGQLKDILLLTLVNIEEESTLKNVKVVQKTTNGSTRYEHPPVFLNLYLLFSANFPENYENALIRLSQVIRFFQSKRVFNLLNTTSPTILASANDTANPDREALAAMELFLDLYTMTFEQINHLWGSLGGKQIPFVMYKARLVIIREPRFTAEPPVIEEVGRDDRPITENP